MYRKHKTYSNGTKLNINESYEGETIEMKVKRMTTNKEPIEATAAMIYTDRKEGVKGEYDIRNDKWETALEAMDKASEQYKKLRESRIGERTYDTMTTEQQKEFNTKFPNNKHNKKTDGGTPASTS